MGALHSVVIDNSQVGLDDNPLGCYADLPPHEAVLVFGSNYDVEPDDGQRLQPGVPD
jgi:hypothetical protein